MDPINPVDVWISMDCDIGLDPTLPRVDCGLPVINKTNRNRKSRATIDPNDMADPAYEYTHPYYLSPEDTEMRRGVLVVLPRPLRFPIRRGTGQTCPARFQPPAGVQQPNDIFWPTTMRLQDGARTLTRFTRRDNARQMLIYTAGFRGPLLEMPERKQQEEMQRQEMRGRATREQRKAGWCFQISPTGANTGAGGAGQHTEISEGFVCDRLEHKGPLGDPQEPTEHAADLRAVIAALRFRNWFMEGFTSVVVVNSNPVVVRLITESLMPGNPAADANRSLIDGRLDKELWYVILGEVERCAINGLKVEFWCVDEIWNQNCCIKACEATRTYSSLWTWHDFKGLNL